MSTCTLVDAIGTVALSGVWPQIRGVEDVVWHRKPPFHANGNRDVCDARVCIRSGRTLGADERCSHCRFIGCGRTIVEHGRPTRTVCDAVDALTFHAHLDACEQCREQPFALCDVGQSLLAGGAP